MRTLASCTLFASSAHSRDEESRERSWRTWAKRLRMRIVYIITRADEIGGVQVHVRDLALALHRSGHEVTVLSGAPGPLFDQLRAGGVLSESVPELVRPIAPWHDAVAVQQLAAILRRLQPDLVSTHSSKAGWLGRIASRLSGVPVVFTAHGWPFTGNAPRFQRWLYPRLERLAAPLADHIITVSDHDRAIALEKRIASEHQITRIHNGVIDDPGTHQVRPESGPARVVMTGRLSPQKNHAGLLRALAGLRHLEWVLELIGDGPARTDLIEMARTSGIEDRVHLLGARNDVADILGRADIYTLVSHWEGFPRSILEAMRAGLPVLATAVGGVAEAVQHGKTGFLVPHANDKELATRLEQLITDRALRQRLGVAGRQSYEEHFRFELMLQRTMAIYANVVGRADVKVAQNLTI
jgi:glycosyltransferase involved in cell wall biosynthesis